ncbi:MAG: tRNA (adenosine(37)-N6)-threonylcarbamoyltransferase complex ATPase subunit type 1 TsaE [Actinomycetia bacterium]|nr:tRNA (adenosine(37)-N6)-threonylcarbamoyltransferase complex ATPase subunit type 1 TsaE [Actinomycetes bacterium]MCP4963192.1 tRNA (adenosine(37)-N6)-threonylcarbamoyltransferase complex ATPase subunit type 1 TsaE [Actinomycetes bacterium]
MIEIASDSVDETRSIASAVASVTRPGDLIVLAGDLGAGKTAFVQGFGAAVGVADRITSPTFTLVHEYRGETLDVHHLDVYRLDGPGEVLDLALPELLDDDCVTIIEWGDLVASELPRSYLVVRIHMGDPISPDDRVLRFESVGEVWSDRLEQIKDLSSAAAVRSC